MGDVQEKLDRLTDEFMRSMEAASSVGTKRVLPTPLQISTLTIAGRYDVGSLPIQIIRDSLSPIDSGGLYLAVSKVVKHRASTFVPKASAKKFDHQVSFKLGTSSVKLFFNGSVHGTGFAAISDFLHMTNLIAQYIWDVLEIRVKLVDFDVHMINVSTSTVDSEFAPIRFPMKRLADCFRLDGCRVDFDPERHPAVKVVLFDGDKKVSTCFVFPTGSVSIFGSREPRFVADIFEIVFRTMDRVGDIAVACEPRRTTVKKSLDVSHGYPSSMIKLLNSHVKI